MFSWLYCSIRPRYFPFMWNQMVELIVDVSVAWFHDSNQLSTGKFHTDVTFTFNSDLLYRLITKSNRNYWSQFQTQINYCISWSNNSKWHKQPIWLIQLTVVFVLWPSFTKMIQRGSSQISLELGHIEGRGSEITGENEGAIEGD